MGWRTPRRHRAGALVAVLVLSIGGPSCAKRVAVDEFPPGTVRVGYLAATDYTDCLVASVSMCANYVLGGRRFSPVELRRDLTAAGLDHALVADVGPLLAERGFELRPLVGELSDAPPLGLGWWVLQRGYPVTCVVNKFAGNADYNHAIVVIGINGGGSAESAEAVYVLDPASPKRLERWERLEFLHYWGSAGRVMLPLFETPGDAPRAVGAPAGESR